MSTELPTIREVVNGHFDRQRTPSVPHLIDELIAREQQRIEMLAEVAVLQFGVHPEFFAEVMATLELGAPITTEQRAYIHSQFHQHLEELRRQYGENGDSA